MTGPEVLDLLSRSGYDVAWHEKRIVVTCSLLPALPTGSQVLDLGSDPAVLHVLATAGGYPSVRGATLDPGRPSKWTATLPASGRFPERSYDILNCDLQQQRIPVDDDSIDLVTCFETIEHVLDPMHLLIEANRVLRSGGRIILSTPNVLSWASLVRSAIGRHPLHYPWLLPDRHTNRHNIEYTPGQLGSLLESAGFEPNVTTRNVWGRKVSLLRKALLVLAGFDPRRRGDILFAVGTKVGRPRLRWDPEVYSLTEEQRKRGEDPTLSYSPASP